VSNLNGRDIFAAKVDKKKGKITTRNEQQQKAEE